MKSKGTTAEELHAMSVRAGHEIPAEALKAKFDMMDKIASGESPKWECHKGAHGGPMGWFKLFQQFVQEKNVTPEEIHEMSKEAGSEMSVEQIKEKLAKMPEWIKMGDMWKQKMAEGKCG